MIPTVIAPHPPVAPLGETPVPAKAPLNPLPAGGYGVHTSRITPLNPPFPRGETGKSSSLPNASGRVRVG